LKLSLILLLCSVSTHLLASESFDDKKSSKQTGFLYGVGIALNQEIYQGYDKRIIPLPIIGYQGEKIKILGPFISYHLASIENVDISLMASPIFQGFDASDSKVFAGMADRDSSLAAGLGLNYKNEQWKLDFSATHDILNTSNGHLLNASLAHVFNKGPIFIEPSLSVSYQDSNYIDYYYGVKDNEVTVSRSAFTGKGAVNKSIGLSISTPIFFDGFTRLATQYTRYDSSITNSPLVDKNYSFSVTLLFSRFW
jgi:outer membrane protein